VPFPERCGVIDRHQGQGRPAGGAGLLRQTLDNGTGPAGPAHRQGKGEVVQIHHCGIARDGADQGVQGRCGMLRPRISHQIADRRGALAGQHETAGRVEAQPVLETVAAFEMVRKADGGDRRHGVQISNRHRPPVQAGQRMPGRAAM
jgi:hypothetical protein